MMTIYQKKCTDVSISKVHTRIFTVTDNHIKNVLKGQNSGRSGIQIIEQSQKINNGKHHHPKEQNIKKQLNHGTSFSFIDYRLQHHSIQHTKDHLLSTKSSTANLTDKTFSLPLPLMLILLFQCNLCLSLSVCEPTEKTWWWSWSWWQCQ